MLNTEVKRRQEPIVWVSPLPAEPGEILSQFTTSQGYCSSLTDLVNQSAQKFQLKPPVRSFYLPPPDWASRGCIYLQAYWFVQKSSQGRGPLPGMFEDRMGRQRGIKCSWWQTSWRKSNLNWCKVWKSQQEMVQSTLKQGKRWDRAPLLLIFSSNFTLTPNNKTLELVAPSSTNNKCGFHLCYWKNLPQTNQLFEFLNHDFSLKM